MGSLFTRLLISATQTRRTAATRVLGFAAATALCTTMALAQQSFGSPPASGTANTTGTVRYTGVGADGTSNSISPATANTGAVTPQLRQSPLPTDRTNPAPSPPNASAGNGVWPTPPAYAYTPSEFELYVQSIAPAGQVVRRLGADLMLPMTPATEAESSPLVPDDYVVVSGDELSVSLWGTVDADLHLVVDRSGRVVIPRVGAVLVAGLRLADLKPAISHQVARVFKNTEVAVSLSKMRGLRIYVTGFVARPGVYTVTNLTTLSAALIQAGGPNAAGSFRTIQLRRKGQAAPLGFDLYELLARGDRGGDMVLQPDDVIHVGPIGPEVAVIGSVNQPAVVELKDTETLEDALRYTGGLSTVADPDRLTLERLGNRNGDRIEQISMPQGLRQPARRGDVLRAFSAVEAKIPLGRQNKRVIVEGEVLRPGQYVLPSDSSLQDALRAAGGLAPNAYIYATQFTRESVRLAQEENYERALRDLETDLTRSATTQRASTADEIKAQDARTAAASKLVERLRSIRPTGRVVLQLGPSDHSLPTLALEDGDRIYIPSKPTSIGVFGSVFNASSYLYADGKSIQDFVNLAGGPTRGADKESTFVIRANGSVTSVLQDSNWLAGPGLDRVPALPGDTIFVPEELNKTTFVQSAKDWTQIIYQLGLGVAAINAIK